ncbi:hypothetical protein [Hyphomonas sp.]|uniref:hypothetical protein n=1 Tax=Hyphomonas sp. TaxID=87 RepID=UPI000C4B3333|nr:hypothetical protein [Hyphomonas sp.]MAU65879.1 hypothetical protein [Hyphomonas sp.]MBM56899.1 hypothetical protein [Hyphomonas sp.]
MADIAGLAASAAGGGLFGLVGTVIGRIAGVVEARQLQAHERARWAHESTMQKLRIEADAAGRAADLREAETSGAWAGLSASLAAEAAIGESYKWVNAVRALTRPALTVLLWGMTGAVFLGADAAGQSGIVDTATFAATAATLWWFGDRGPRRDMR